MFLVNNYLSVCLQTISDAVLSLTPCPESSICSRIKFKPLRLYAIFHGFNRNPCSFHRGLCCYIVWTGFRCRTVVSAWTWGGQEDCQRWYRLWSYLHVSSLQDKLFFVQYSTRVDIRNHNKQQYNIPDATNETFFFFCTKSLFEFYLHL